jgi:Peptidase family M28
MGLPWLTQTAEKSLSNGGTLKLANIAARIKGSGKPGLKAVLLVAHYDSVPDAPGACDDGSGTAALLETIRSLKAGPLPKRDIIALFTDGEEIGLIGSKVFVGESRGGIGPGHPWMADVGLVLNIEAAGNRGACCLFETSEHNGWLVREFARADPVAIGNSLSSAVYRLTGGATDMNSFLAAGVSGLNFVFFEGKECYHTPLDTPSKLDGRSLQHQGLHSLTLSRHFGNLEQDDPREPDAVYFNPVGHWFVVYPGSWVKPLAIGATVLYAGVVFLAWRSGRVKAGGLAAGFVVFPIAIALGTLATWGVWWLLKLVRAPADRGETIGGPVAAVLLGAALIVFISIYGVLWKRAGVCALDFGALGWWTILTVGSAWLLPGGSFGALWPLVFRPATTALAWRIPWPPAATLLIDLGALPAITIIGAGAYALFATRDPSTITVAAAVAPLVPGAILPQLSRLFAQ